MKVALPLAIAATGCIPDHDYAGDYDMTYDVVMTPAAGTASSTSKIDARAGTTEVVVHHGLNEEYLVNLGSSFCRLEGSYVKAMVETDWPYMDIAPQPCWFIAGTTNLPMSLAGTATFDKGDNRFAIVLSGTYTDGDAHGSATVQLTETW